MISSKERKKKVPIKSPNGLLDLIELIEKRPLSQDVDKFTCFQELHFNSFLYIL